MIRPGTVWVWEEGELSVIVRDVEVEHAYRGDQHAQMDGWQTMGSIKSRRRRLPGVHRVRIVSSLLV